MLIKLFNFAYYFDKIYVSIPDLDYYQLIKHILQERF